MHDSFLLGIKSKKKIDMLRKSALSSYEYEFVPYSIAISFKHIQV